MADFNDLGISGGAEAIKEALGAARAVMPEPPDYLYEGELGDAVDEAGETTKIRATPFIWRAEEDIPPRAWLYGRHLLRKFLSVDVAAGGVGKSSVKIVQSLEMAANRSIYGKEIFEGPLRVWLYNLEDPAEETERRLHAAAKHFHIEPDHVADRLFVDSGRAQRCVIATETIDGARIIAPVSEAIVAEILARGIDVLILDPFVSSHELSENDNRAMDLVAKEWGRIADICNCSINLVHHVRKQNGEQANVDSARGAKSLTDAARSVVVYNRMTEDEAERASIPKEQRGFYFRAQNDKANLAPPEAADWFRMNNVELANGDNVGVACPWLWPDAFEGVSTSDVRSVQKAIAEGKWRESVQALAWVGKPVADCLGMDPETDKKRLQQIIKEWIRNGVLRVVEGFDDRRKAAKFVEVGQWLTD